MDWLIIGFFYCGTGQLLGKCHLNYFKKGILEGIRSSGQFWTTIFFKSVFHAVGVTAHETLSQKNELCICTNKHAAK